LYIYNLEASSYKKVNISGDSGKGFWVYVYKCTTISIEESTPLKAENISLLAKRSNLLYTINSYRLSS